VAIDAAKVPAGECGVENQVGRVGVSLLLIAWHPLHPNICVTTRFVSVGST